MRVVLVVPTFPKLSETFVSNKAVGLAERGVDVHIVCASSPKEEWDNFAAGHRIHGLRDRVHLTAPSIRRGTITASLAEHARAAAAIPAPVRRNYLSNDTDGWGARIRHLLADAPVQRLRADVVHFEFGSLAVGRTDIGQHGGTAMTVSFRGFDLAYVGLENANHYRDVWTSADGIHVLSEALWRRALERGAPENLAHTVIPPAVDADSIQISEPRPGRLGTVDSPLRILAVGRLHWVKGYDHMLDAIARAVHQGLHVEVRIVGDGDLFEWVHYWRHDLGLDEIVTFVGALPADEVAQQFQWADLFVQASTFEGFCNAALEAQAHGVPVVSTDAYGLADNVEHGRTGLVVGRRDPASMASAIDALAADGDKRAAMGNAGAERARTRFGLHDQLDDWISFYETAIQRRR
ncbi:MAG: glycosyltransferase family 4 protein [Acidimicrobiales bacterium]|nr:glycosyltransferase family 4 protein [Acidimicrobiales bacterium]